MGLLLSVWFYSVINTNYAMTTHNMISWICGESIFYIQSTMSTSSYIQCLSRRERLTFDKVFHEQCKIKMQYKNINAAHK